MLHFQIFTDGSVNTQLGVGYGACLVLPKSLPSLSFDRLKGAVELKRFEKTSSTKLELQAFLWAVDKVVALADGRDLALTVYTDSQNIIGLAVRRSRLEKSHYLSAKKKRLNNYELYQKFYSLLSDFDIELVKLLGHQPSSQRGEADRLFHLVDQASRRALRDEF